ncbi:MAG: TRAP transporter substrate-binding protein DctP [Treponema sp.]|nr:TRAP transporter substrate-binding protein DctP [Treponema sp.]
MKIFSRQKLQFIFILLLLFLVLNPVFAQRTMNIKLASLAPENTAWGQAINRMAADWARITNGLLNVTVFHGGTAGDESQVMALVRSNQIQAGVFTSMGLNSVVPELMAVSFPFLIRNDDELDEVLGKVKSDLNERIQRNGFVNLAWARAGWIKIFTRSPIVTPDDLRRLRLATGSDDQQMIQAFRLLSYQIVPANVNELLFSLQSGRADAVYSSPIFVAANQLFGIASNMSSINVAPFMGGILMNEVTWRRIPDRFKPELLEATKRMERDIEASIAGLETEAISTMVRHGLKINTLTPAQQQVWFDDTNSYENRLIGGANPTFNREYYLKVKDILTEYRRGR